MIALDTEPTIRYTASPLMIDLAPGWCKVRGTHPGSNEKSDPVSGIAFRLMPSW